MTHTQTQGADGAGTKTAGEWSPLTAPPEGWFISKDAETGEVREVRYCGGHDHTYRDRQDRVFAPDLCFTPAPAATPGVPDSVREAAAALIADLDRSLVSSRDHAVIAATNASVKRLRALIAAQPAGQAGDAGANISGSVEVIERCVKLAQDAGLDSVTITGSVSHWQGILSKLHEHAPNSTRTGVAETDATKVLASRFENLLMGHAEVWGGSIGRASIASLASEIAALAARPEAPSDAGWVLAPVEPTSEMIDAARETTKWGAGNWGDLPPGHDTYRAMIAARPLPTPPSDPAPSGQAEG